MRSRLNISLAFWRCTTASSAVTVDLEAAKVVEDDKDGFRDFEVDVVRLIAEGCCVLDIRDPRFGLVMADERGPSMPGPKLRAMPLRFCVVVVVGRVVDELACFPTIILDLFAARLFLFALWLVAPVTVPLRFKPVPLIGAFSFSKDPSVPPRLILARLLAVCFTIMLAGRGLLAFGAGRALNSRLLDASSSSRLSFASLSALRLAAIASPGREKVG
jgi:hypothetical protein